MRCACSASKDAFTLVEIILSVVILSVTIALAIPNFSKTFYRLELRKTADNIVYLIRYGQSRAVTERKTYLLNFTEGLTHYQLLRGASAGSLKEQDFTPISHAFGRLFKVPNSVAISSEVNSVKIYSDGTLDKVRIHLKGKDRGLVLSSMEQRSNVFILDEDIQS
jgi:prepilin-type N-terminal cleavage/methylation domain-containing protein